MISVDVKPQRFFFFSVFSPVGTLISASAAPHCGIVARKQLNKKGHLYSRADLSFEGGWVGRRLAGAASAVGDEPQEVFVSQGCFLRAPFHQLLGRCEAWVLSRHVARCHRQHRHGGWNDSKLRFLKKKIFY